MVEGDVCTKIPKLNLKMFSATRKTKTVQVKSKEVALKTDSMLFGHMIMIAEKRRLELKTVLRHPLGPLLSSLANLDEPLKRTSKSKLSQNLRRNFKLLTHRKTHLPLSLTEGPDCAV